MMHTGLKSTSGERAGPWVFPELAKSLFIANSLNQEDVLKQEFKAEDLNLNFVGAVDT